MVYHSKKSMHMKMMRTIVDGGLRKEREAEGEM